jgi:hypothetical protein
MGVMVSLLQYVTKAENTYVLVKYLLIVHRNLPTVYFLA